MSEIKRSWYDCRFAVGIQYEKDAPHLTTDQVQLYCCSCPSIVAPLEMELLPLHDFTLSDLETLTAEELEKLADEGGLEDCRSGCNLWEEKK